jgi:hypothetical protein
MMILILTMEDDFLHYANMPNNGTFVHLGLAIRHFINGTGIQNQTKDFI